MTNKFPPNFDILADGIGSQDEELIEAIPLFEAIKSNNISEVEKFSHLAKKLNAHIPLSSIAIYYKSFETLEYLLKCGLDDLKSSTHKLSPLLLLGTDDTHRFTPLLLTYGFLPNNSHQQRVISSIMKSLTPSIESIRLMRQAFLHMSMVLMTSDLLVLGEINEDKASSLANEHISKIPMDFFMQQFGNEYWKILTSDTFGRHEYQSIQQLSHGFRVFNWLFRCCDTKYLYLVGEPLQFEVNEHLKEYENLANSRESIEIHSWAECIDSSKIIATLIKILEKQIHTREHIKNVMEQYDWAPDSFEYVELNSLWDLDAIQSLPIMQERLRALRWLSGVNEVYIRC